MKIFFLLIVSLFFIISCSSNKTDQKVKEEEKVVNEIHKSSKIVEIETLFNEDQFDDPIKEILLKELKICSEDNKGPEDYLNPACSPRFFELFQVSDNTPLNSAFILQMKSKTNGFPLRRLVVFVRERGVLIKVNGFVANLIERRVSDSVYDDLVFRFNNKDQGQDVFFNCLFKWTGKAYEYSSVEVIEGIGWGGPVKKELIDSISIEVFKDIQKNKMIF